MKFICTFFLLTLVFLGQAQIGDYKWGKVSKYESDFTSCSFEPTANAVVLNDEGKIEISSGHVLITRQKRIKILHKSGIDQANIQISFYTKNDLETVRGVKAQTININENGKTVKIKVEPKKIFEVDLDPNWKAKRFTFPEVKVGSIIEYTYTTYSKNYHFLEGWVFQSHIPTLRSKLTALIPEYLDYRILFEGRKTLQKYGRSEAVNGWELKNIHSIKDEPYAANYMDYAEKIRFQLAGYNKIDKTFNNSSEYVNTMTTWENMAKEILANAKYLGYLSKSGRAKTILESLQVKKDGSFKNAQIIYDYVKNNYSWNNKNRILTANTFPEFIKTKEGNNVEINLLLILLLRNAGFTADPVLLSTRSHGKIVKAYPFISQFNYMVCNVNLGGEEYLIDATDPLRPMKMLDEGNLNEEGYLLHKSHPRWVKIKPFTKTLESTYILAHFEDNGELVCEMNIKYAGYFASKWRRSNDIQKITSNLEEHWVDSPFGIDSIQVLNLPEIDKPLEIKLYLKSKSSLLEEDIVYLEPILKDSYNSNPFKSESRQFPVDYGYPRKHSYVLNLQLPENYRIDDSPVNQIVSIPNKAGTFRYVSKDSGGNYQLSYSVSIDKPSIPSIHYGGLREFYNIIISKLDEVVVLKKK